MLLPNAIMARLANYRFVEHARLAVFVLAAGTIDEAVAQDVVVDAAVTSDNVWSGTSEPLHAVLSRGAF